MKLPFLCAAVLLTAVFVFGPKISLEAKHHSRSHFSVNFGPVFGYPSPYVVERYPAPAYVEERVFGNPYSPYAYRERVYVQPAPQYYVYPRPALFTGFSFGWFN